ncbi:YbdK family carboxylate-amine ligase [Nonomuraea sp. NPDC046570]|uniref:carboxylate-amine ligase n=1 Tax=Nonomuraea sp. NPDC046570 TaxID=3155255 RepID=UPI0033CE4B4B
MEEEFFLLDSDTGALAPMASQILATLDDDSYIKPEAMRYQLETVTGVCASLDQVAREVTERRLIAAEAAERFGCHLVASGIAPGYLPELVPLTDHPRYKELAKRYPQLVATTGTCGCHVHIGIPSRELGLLVIGRLRPWLATLLAISANSPIADCRDTTWASWRYRRWSRWPSATAPRAWRSVEEYDAEVRELIRAGKILDERSVYFYARLSPRYPTVEVRVMDTCLSVDDTVLVAALVRAMVAAAVEDIRAGTPVTPLPDHQVAADLSAAARYGLGGVAAALPDRIALVEPVSTLLSEFVQRGTGAERQRALWNRSGTLQEFSKLMADATLGSALPTLSGNECLV